MRARLYALALARYSRTGWMTGMFLGALAVSVPSGAYAAAPPQARPAVPPKDAPAGKDAPKTGLFDETPDDLYEQRDRVDPFTLGKPLMPPTTEPILPPGPEGDPPPTGDEWAGKLHEMRRNYADAEKLLSQDDATRFTKIRTDCKTHTSVVQNQIQDMLKKETGPGADKTLSGFQTLIEKFRRLEATADRLEARQRIESEFAGKNVRVQGIVWRPQSPSAAVNEQKVTEGTVLQIGGDKGGTAQVYRINRDSVVFMYRGIQVTAYLQRGSR